ncbi:unnamed protein product [Euphydryas editha]|uniref:Uncharacterized protein n=1 Tax=Euphydryas editha TaxID=104508 RepID=A0AAU9V3Z4_EUPED|nr:unnamed protein product [Euphydryas editha]
MANILPMLLSLFVLQAASMAAPRDNNLVDSKYAEESSKFDSLPSGEDNQSSNDNEKNQRQKRFYDYKAFAYAQSGYPTSFPYPFQPHFSKNDESQNTGLNGAEDVLSQIHRRLEQILSNVRQYAYPVHQQTPIATFIPLLLIPHISCGCTTNTEHPPTTQQVNINKPQPSTPIETTTPDLENRFSGIDDTRRNWGILVNNTDLNADFEGDGNRPISFNPVIPESPIDVPVPPVEHGSVQAGVQPEPIPTSTFRAILNSPAIAPPRANRPSAAGKVPSIAPSACDAAVISCCLRNQVTPNCFVQNGCPDTSKYGQPCDPSVIYNVVKKVQHYIEQRKL